jgi:hypothetical protein
VTTVYAYRRSIPPTFVTAPGNFQLLWWQLIDDIALSGETALLPGFDAICSVKANLVTPFLSAPVKKAWHGRWDYRVVEVTRDS